jgi:hypothetical protein
MTIQVFKNNKGLIHGTDPKRVGCGINGTLKIGSAEVNISAETEAVMPVLFNGSNGIYNATFISSLGHTYELEKVTIKAGRIVPPTQTSVEFMELRCRVEALEAECETLREEVRNLGNIFDTNSLNFLIK